MPSARRPGAKTVQVDVKRGDELGPGVPAPMLIKIDVEGFELQVLQGLLKTLTDAGPCLCLELHPEYLKELGESVGTVESLLRSLDYTCIDSFERTKDHRQLHKIFAKRSAGTRSVRRTERREDA